MANIVKLTGCKEVSHDIYAYFTCDAEKALKVLELEIPCTGANSTGAYNIYFNDGGETICEYMTFCVTREFKKVSSIQDAVEWMDKKRMEMSKTKLYYLFLAVMWWLLG